MITIRQIPFKEIKEKHSNSLGFVFQGPDPSSDEAIVRLCQKLVDERITVDYPYLVVRLDPLTVLFLYKNSFNSPLFLHKASIPVRMGICKIADFRNFLENLV